MTKLTVVTILYNRIDKLDSQIKAMQQQDLEENWEWVIWNNNSDKAREITATIEKYENLKVSLIHSHSNFHCLARQAIAPLCNGELIMFMDDDIVPTARYLSFFVAEHKRLVTANSNAPVALAACGHQFSRDIVSVNAKQVWEKRVGLNFYDQFANEIELHFLHANNCILERSLFLKFSSYPLPNREFGLVDDYWMSYVLSRHLLTKLIKINAVGIFDFTDCAFSEDVAMFYRRDVHQARLKFFEYHMEKNWPFQ